MPSGRLDDIDSIGNLLLPGSGGEGGLDLSSLFPHGYFVDDDISPPHNSGTLGAAIAPGILRGGGAVGSRSGMLNGGTAGMGGFDLTGLEGGMGFDLSSFFGSDAKKDSQNGLFDLLLGLGLSQKGIGDVNNNLFSGIEV